MFRMQEAWTTVLSTPRLKCLLRSKLEWIQAHPYKLVAAWVRILLTFLVSSVSWVPGNIMTESATAFRTAAKTHSAIFCIIVWSKFEEIVIWSFTHTVRAWWRQLAVMAAHNCHAWCQWCSENLCITVSRLWLDSYLSFLFWFGWNWHNGYL
jgi:hypothetical protein